MGSLTSGPKVSTPQPQIIYVPQAVNNTTQAATTSGNTTTGTTSETSAESEEKQNAAARKQSLLGRDRSVFGTIRTSFRGLLGLNDNGATSLNRKTLLGE